LKYETSICARGGLVNALKRKGRRKTASRRGLAVAWEPAVLENQVVHVPGGVFHNAHGRSSFCFSVYLTVYAEGEGRFPEMEKNSSQIFGRRDEAHRLIW
jgi:hypothetical protein